MLPQTLLLPLRPGSRALREHSRCSALGRMPWKWKHLGMVPGHRAEEQCRRWFDVSDCHCTSCSNTLPGSFFYRGQSKCISCTRAYYRLYQERLVPGALPSSKQCTNCQRTLSAASFAKSRSTASGLQSYCRMCHRVVRREQMQSWRRLPLPAALQSSERGGAVFASLPNPAAPSPK